MMDKADRYKLYDVEKSFEWDKWRQQIPYLSFDPNWLVRAIPPFSTGVIRYNLKHKDIPHGFVSIYLDCYDCAGCVGKPYWEVYPVDGDCGRCLLDETEKLLDYIRTSFDEQRAAKAA